MLFADEAMDAMSKIRAHASKMNSMTATTAASFLSETSAEGAALPKINVVMDAPDAPVPSSDHVTAALRASQAATSVMLFADEATDALRKIRTQISKVNGMTG